MFSNIGVCECINRFDKEKLVESLNFSIDSLDKEINEDKRLIGFAQRKNIPNMVIRNTRSLEIHQNARNDFEKIKEELLEIKEC